MATKPPTSYTCSLRTYCSWPCKSTKNWTTPLCLCDHTLTTRCSGSPKSKTITAAPCCRVCFSTHSCIFFGPSRIPILLNQYTVTYWLVVWTPLKNISQLGWLFPIHGKIKDVPNHQPAYHITSPVIRSRHVALFLCSSPVTLRRLYGTSMADFDIFPELLASSTLENNGKWSIYIIYTGFSH